MRFALVLSQIRKKISQQKRLPIDAFLASLIAAATPAIPKDIPFSKILSWMQKDKKVKDGKIRFVLLKDIGQVVTGNQVGEEDLIQAYNTLRRA
jgi:3-dehydroquinate synthetase